MYQNNTFIHFKPSITVEELTYVYLFTTCLIKLTDFLFPSTIRQDDMKVCENEIKVFCKDYVERAEVMFILATISCGLVIMSLVRYSSFSNRTINS